jgi:hypothetical protein
VHLREAGAIVAREKDLIEEVNSKSSALEEFNVKYSEMAKRERQALDENFRLDIIISTFEKKLSAYEKKDVEHTEVVQQLKHDVN